MKRALITICLLVSLLLAQGCAAFGTKASRWNAYSLPPLGQYKFLQTIEAEHKHWHNENK